MKSRIHIARYLLSFLPLVFLLCCFIGVSLDETVNDTALWYISGLSIIGLVVLHIKTHQHLPKIEISNDNVSFKSKNLKGTFKISEIIEIRQIKTDVDLWFTKRGGILIKTKEKNYKMPLHIYSNEKLLLQKLYQIKEITIQQIILFEPSALKYLKYLYRNFYSLYLLLSIPFIWLLFSSQNHNLISIFFLSMISILLILVFKRTTKFVELNEKELEIIDPLLLNREKILVKNIEQVNSKPIPKVKGSLKGLTLVLSNKKVITVIAALNSQAALDLIAKQINAKLTHFEQSKECLKY